MLPLEALHEALASWRKTKHPRFATVARWATARLLAAEPPRPLVGDSGKKADVAAWFSLLEAGDPLDVPRLVATVGGGNSTLAAERVGLLSRLNDPRVNEGLLALLEVPPYRARTALAFFRAATRALQDSGDPRVRPALEDLARRYKSILETSVGDDVSALLRRTAEAIDQVKPGPLPAALEARCAQLEALFETEQTQAQRGSSQQKTARHHDDALLAAIYAAPEDDTPRMVFADALTERGDARGEFIALQVGRARGAATPAQLLRERALKDDPKVRAAWALPLSQGGECHLARGFPDELMVEPRMLKTIVGNPAARTLRSVDGLSRSVSLKQARAFLFHEVCAGIVKVSGITAELFEGFEGPLPWPEIGLSFLPSRAELTRLPHARALSVSNTGTALSTSTFVGFEQLLRLTIGSGVPLVPAEVLFPLVQLSELTLPGWYADFGAALRLASLPGLRRLSVGFCPGGAQLEGLRLESLECRFGVTFDGEALLRALPQLVELRVSNLPRTVVGKLASSEQVRRLRFLALDGFHFLQPYTPQGVLELRTWNRVDYERHGEVLAVLPEGCVSRVLVRPAQADPWASAGPPPVAEAVEALRQVAKVPVELAWY